MTLTLEKGAADEAQQAQLLFKEARQRRRRRRAIGVGVAVAVVAAGLAITVESRSPMNPAVRTNRSPITPTALAVSRTGATLITAYNSLRVLDADSGATRTVPLPAPAGGSSDLSMTKIGRSLILNRGDTAWLYPPGLRGAPLDLGPSLRVIPGPVDSQVWIWSNPCAETVCSDAAKKASNGTVRLVDDAGRQIGSPVPLPVDANWFPTGQSLSAGLVLTVAYGPGPSGQSEIWQPTSNHVVRTLPSEPLAAHGDWIATESAKSCPPDCSIQITDIRSGQVEVIPLPRRTYVSGFGAVSPGGTRLALVGTLNGSQRQWPSAIIVVDLAMRTSQVLRNSNAALRSAYGDPPISWSGDGWLFATRIGGSDVLAWRSGLRAMAVLPKVKLPDLHLDPPQYQTEDPTMLAL